MLLDNGALGKISKEQLAGRLPVWQTSLVNPDFAALCFSVIAKKTLIRNSLHK